MHYSYNVTALHYKILQQSPAGLLTVITTNSTVVLNSYFLMSKGRFHAHFILNLNGYRRQLATSTSQVNVKRNHHIRYGVMLSDASRLSIGLKVYINISRAEPTFSFGYTLPLDAGGVWKRLEMYFRLVVALSLGVAVLAGPPTAETPLGRLRGHYLETRGGRKIAAFTGIPYAKPPVGDLRFKVTLALVFVLFFFRCQLIVFMFIVFKLLLRVT